MLVLCKMSPCLSGATARAVILSGPSEGHQRCAYRSRCVLPLMCQCAAWAGGFAPEQAGDSISADERLCFLPNSKWRIEGPHGP